eukprot:TRINITY_DN3055_c0_g1::TRINITY_DN3055_c0_g1_i1::g.22240::m.22240 TRINITY_DN3055_c0_g1::TRINITY_DN3055_c0_g1_i1::g.22240  ORF type:complete len:606 (-),score=44.77,sp/Q9FN03/UVR8_ARATH/27.65/2e-32,sp/Q9FN03/UVR8_ARATH/24.40/7e-16,sp/Q9FN03/UVR8_ARATH/25.61/3e-08,RCC1/PF00415.13/2.3,RCC1/PF00415.13/2.2e-12,RCC1/PF00415.13/7.9e-08,RCC1/PF00415.13/7e-06,RCC1/PF00415.13/0.1,RCC1/PF00415.13/1e+02,RCC1/PF00415.13/2.7e-07,RCC1/PF00415.13/4e-06,RCC1_2/PF13540.1/7.7e-06,RCC1_2/PF13540.1/3.4e-05,RCC1_2/PF13
MEPTEVPPNHKGGLLGSFGKYLLGFLSPSIPVASSSHPALDELSLENDIDQPTTHDHLGDCYIDLEFDVCQPTPAPIAIGFNEHIVAAAAGERHCLVVSKDGKVFSWGDQRYGLLGRVVDVDESSSEVHDVVPRPVSGLDDVRIVEIVCGDRHTLALSDTKSVYSWGCALYGRLGHPMSTPFHCDADGDPFQPLPLFIEGLRDIPIKQIACGAHTSFFLAEDGQAYSCGSSELGCLGYALSENDNSDENDFQATPRIIPFSDTVAQITARHYHCLALTESGDVYAWGVADSGLCGEIDWDRDSHTTHTRTPSPPTSCPHPDDGRATPVTSGIHEQDDTVVTSSPLAGTETGCRTDPYLIDTVRGLNIKRLACGALHNVILTHDGTLYTWGDARDGLLGVGVDPMHKSPFSQDSQGDPFSSTPRPVSNLPPIRAVRCGNAHTLALGEDGLVYAWGHAPKGVLGIPVHVLNTLPMNQEDEPYAAVPVPIVSLPRAEAPDRDENVVFVTCGRHTSLAVTSKGNAFIWGQLPMDQRSIELEAAAMESLSRLENASLLRASPSTSAENASLIVSFLRDGRHPLSHSHSLIHSHSNSPPASPSRRTRLRPK